jgi:C1A family cysteine protease
MTKRGYGWVRGHGDIRDHIHAPTLRALPSHIDITPSMPAVYDQGELGSCTENALGAAFEYALIAKGHDYMPSRLWLYYEVRAAEGTVSYDAGSVIRDGAKVLSHMGCPPETAWPYRVTKFATKPPAAVTRAALAHRVLAYARVVQDRTDIQSTLADGFPIVFGFTVYESFESQEVADTGVVPMPEPDESVLGGHAVVLVGYDQPKDVYIVRNSWGTDWGKAGYFTMPCEYVENATLADDFWVLREVE